MDSLGSSTHRAKREVRTIMRRLATDKLIVVMFVLVMLAIATFLLIRIGKFIYDKFKTE